MKVQIASDLHLEFYDSKALSDAFFQTLVEPVPGTDVLILAGDIGYVERSSTKQFLAWCCKCWPHVIWVLGNHEYYNKRPSDEWHCSSSKTLTMAEKEDLAESYMLTHVNLYVLANTYVVIPGFEQFRFVGTTLWTDIPEDKRASLSYYMGDFVYIQSAVNPPNPFSVDEWVDLHYDSREFLQDQFQDAKSQNQKTIVITHHLPTYDLILPQYKGSSHNCGFASHCDDLLQEPSVVAWFCGHSHGQRELQIEKKLGGSTQVVLNARGYKNEVSIRTYSPTKVLEL